MREILFSGKRLDNGEWVEGIPIKTHIGTFIVFEENPHYCSQYGYMEIDELVLIDPTTVGQYTGLTDKNGKKIFEGDIVRRNAAPMVVTWNEGDGTFMTECFIDGIRCVSSLLGHERLEVIGNIHDNPELLEVNE